MPLRLYILATIHILLATLAIWRIWRARKPLRDGGIFFPVLWSVVAVFFPLVGPFLALAFGRIPPKHGENAGPSRYTHGG